MFLFFTSICTVTVNTKYYFIYIELKDRENYYLIIDRHSTIFKYKYSFVIFSASLNL